ncbi:tryptophan synthase subunit alpha [Candidatus Magnetobacterium bavaricum]|uniref:tryptophan synthase n=1 Tax=Candidatus Magnetobacterium bavaricum TaxID=29290 RepID=A0A0F3H0J6_9BACT|nr:tryptophan synthase subunit alpha [Candidatus Magnetobacterium bavaricum]
MKKTRITAAFERPGSAQKKAFLHCIMAGDMSLDRTQELVLFLERHGADIVELGVPFSYPPGRWRHRWQLDSQHRPQGRRCPGAIHKGPERRYIGDYDLV